MKPPPSQNQYIDTPLGLRDLCRRLAAGKRLALDTEFVGEQSFVPRLELIQVATEELCAAIDVPAVRSLDPLVEPLTNPLIEKVLHAGRQDVDLFHTHLGQVPGPIFDTQLAAAMVGYGSQVGYANLVQRVLHKKLEKAHTLTNWSQRPLTNNQIHYALEDVQFLLPLHGHLRQRLKELGRLDWIQEEFTGLTSKPVEDQRDPYRRYERIRGWDQLKPQSAGVLRELAAWREEEARQRDLPRGRIIRDEILLELARRRPATMSALRDIRGLSASLVTRQGETLLARIRTGLAVPPSQRPEVHRPPKPDPDTAGRTDLLQAVLKAYAQKAAIAPTLLATAADLQALVDAKEGREQLDLPILKGWRRQVAGEALLRILDGTMLVGMDPRTGTVRTRDQD